MQLFEKEHISQLSIFVIPGVGDPDDRALGLLQHVVDQTPFLFLFFYLKKYSKKIKKRLTRHTYMLPEADPQQHLWFCTLVGGIKVQILFELNIRT